MGYLLSVVFRLALWGLLTADISAINLLIGLALALLLPHAQGPRQPLRPLLRCVLEDGALALESHSCAGVLVLVFSYCSTPVIG